MARSVYRARALRIRPGKLVRTLQPTARQGHVPAKPRSEREAFTQSFRRLRRIGLRKAVHRTVTTRALRPLQQLGLLHASITLRHDRNIAALRRGRRVRTRGCARGIRIQRTLRRSVVQQRIRPQNPREVAGNAATLISQRA